MSTDEPNKLQTSCKCLASQSKEGLTYQVEEAQSDEAEGDGSVEVGGDPGGLRVLVQAWEGMGSHSRVYVQTLLPLLQAWGHLDDCWLEEVDHGEVGDGGRHLVAVAGRVLEVAVDQAVEVQGEGAGHVVQDQENPWLEMLGRMRDPEREADGSRWEEDVCCTLTGPLGATSHAGQTPTNLNLYPQQPVLLPGPLLISTQCTKPTFFKNIPAATKTMLWRVRDHTLKPKL